MLQYDLTRGVLMILSRVAEGNSGKLITPQRPGDPAALAHGSVDFYTNVGFDRFSEPICQEGRRYDVVGRPGGTW
jgi:hypothetical protein